jgi:hypothetical protein
VMNHCGDVELCFDVILLFDMFNCNFLQLWMKIN